jgi:hypothetical protein
MKRTATLLAAVVGVIAIVTGVAYAAASPTVSTHNATRITDGTADLTGAVNPNGNQTTYVFNYGPSTSLGLATPGRSAGHGTKGIVVKSEITNLSPGTRYYFQLVALNKSGAATGSIHAFTTTGHPPAAVVTGPTLDVGKYQATPTGDINPNGAATTWVIQYGLTTAYASQTVPPQSIVAGVAPVPVAAQLTGLAPGKLFHYRIVASHSGSAVTASPDATFFTYPSFRRTPRMSTRTKPGRVTSKPYTFTTSGTLSGANFVPQALRCTGRVTVHFMDGKRQVAGAVATVNPDCSFSTPVPFKRLIKGGPAALTVAIHYKGNGYFKPVDGTDHVTLG